MINNKISIILVGYKEKNLANTVRSIKNATITDNTIYVSDQHSINHEDDFKTIDGCVYEYRIWDELAGPANRRATKVYDTILNFTHICLISADISLRHGWDLELIEMLEQEDLVYSGSGNISVKQKDPFSVSVDYSPSDDFSTTQMIDRNFVFAKSDAFEKIVLPDFLKYFGENEYLSLAFLSAGYDIKSVPSRMYVDSKNRYVENTYHTFSKEHNYNIVVDIMNNVDIDKYKITHAGLFKFLEFHELTIGQLKRIPYQTNDVNYDPYQLKMHKVDGRRFISGTKAIY